MGGGAGVEKLLLDTDRGLVEVSGSPDHSGRKSYAPSHSRTYYFWVPMTRAHARLALLGVHDHRLEMAKAKGDRDVITELEGRIESVLEEFLRAHPAYGDAVASAE